VHSTGSREIAELRLGKNTEQLYKQAEKLHKELNRYACGPPQIHFTDEDVDHARAAGVLIEFDASHSRYSPTNCSTGATTAGGSGGTEPSARRYSSGGQPLAPGSRPRSTRCSARKLFIASEVS